MTDIHSEPYPGKSVVPERCLATFDRRTLPGESESSVLQPLQEIIAQLHDEDNTFQAEAHVVTAEEQCYTGQRLTGTSSRMGCNRDFAVGALKAAQFLVEQGPGLYSMDDVV